MTLGGVLFGKLLIDQLLSIYSLFKVLFTGWAAISGSLLISNQEFGGPGLTTNYVRVRISLCEQYYAVLNISEYFCDR